jgi:hypothetical protein
MKEIDKWLEQYRELWENRFNELDKVLSAAMSAGKRSSKKEKK